MLTTNIRMKIFGVVLSFTVAGSALAEENDWQDIDLPLTQKQFCLNRWADILWDGTSKKCFPHNYGCTLFIAPATIWKQNSRLI